MASPRPWIVTLVVFTLAASAFADEAQRKPNVLFIVSDDYGVEMGAYGNEIVQTPNLDRLAEGSVRFERAYCQFPLCGPSRASFMSGMRPATIGVITNGPTVREKHPDVVTLSQLFRNNGYFAARVGKIYHLGIPPGVGTAGPDDPASWDHTYNPPGAEFTTPGKAFDPDPEYSQGFNGVKGDGEGQEQHDYQAADEAIRLLRENKDKPFFLALGFIRPHVPVTAPKKYFDLYDLDDIKLPEVPPNDRDDIPPAAFHRPEPWWGMSERECRESILAYYASISFMDAQLGRVLDELKKLDLDENTIIVFFGDHGYLLGEHKTWQKMVLFEGAARVPLIIHAPAASQPGGSAKGLVELIDLYPTISELADLDAPSEIEGKSLVPMLKDSNATVKDAAFTQLRRRNAQGRSVRTDRWRYTEWVGEGAGVELYDEINDPNEWNNLASDPAHAETIKELTALLEQGAPLFPERQPDSRPSNRRRNNR